MTEYYDATRIGEIQTVQVNDDEDDGKADKAADISESRDRDTVLTKLRRAFRQADVLLTLEETRRRLEKAIKGNGLPRDQTARVMAVAVKEIRAKHGKEAARRYMAA